MTDKKYWESLGLPAHGTAFTGVVPKGGAAVNKEEEDRARLERKREYERDYNKRRYQLMKAANRVNALRCI